MIRTYTIVALREEDGRFSVSVPALPGCHTWGHDLQEARRMAEDAVRLYLECLQEDGESPPADIHHVAFDMGEAAEAFVLKIMV